MKNLFKVILAMLLAVGILNAEPLSQAGEKDGYELKLTSEKSLIVGDNDNLQHFPLCTVFKKNLNFTNLC